MDDNDEDDDDVFEQVQSFKGVAQSYQLNFASGIRNLHARLETAVREAADQLLTIQRTGRSVKYYLSLRANFYKPTDPNAVTDEPCTFNSGTTTQLPSSSIKTQMEINYTSILQAVENFERNGSGKSPYFLFRFYRKFVQFHPNGRVFCWWFVCNQHIILNIQSNLTSLCVCMFVCLLIFM